ncbi:DNA-binding protein (plasmid) [Haloferax mediterranei ATCC 33500]|uniref:DNA-binding protein n=1 Tax=Haloferax mediterranei (strain ATCC 33500 / DSM 1411 / JCM 8866 / NBRC 14739 / NCIMB 2177 / R-4) TaxID=523841 RepID=I3R940_HALMT|nr:helix-turn-helix domain-containing protein [Haloferax mediterranei]AFK20750.1 HTH DNA binding domain-containing protein [Haloferax mediterranei ATCC 33500]AHZ23998.1 DNA-binding protein [Haloferax mediterranei ATCC 33500]ELZ97579.1 HTH DNA binding domain-containing protein [Haloferax mediterranei ATCC 33500]MDX5989671.1 helix-turn-helix domain-containing protein [Haloferax mediterranei ATCC 33500]QCQ77427.1 DNA-binding protein [Haloferax mediterranei ATCC 33500]
MRYATMVAYPNEEGINRLDRQVTELGLEYRAIHRMELLADDTVAMFAEGRGDVEGLRRVLSESPEVFEFSVSGDDAGFFAYTRYAADDLTRMLMEGRRESSYLIDMPIEHTDDGGLRVTYIGTEAAFADALSDQPDGVRVEVERTGPYAPGSRHVVSQLTERQREVLEVAVDLGYYQEPREATHDEIAAATGLAETTVGEHLRKIEATVFSSLHVAVSDR